MCGIVGFKTRRNFESFKKDLPSAVSQLSHRGPDDSGIFLDESKGLGLGHRRLSVLDPSPSGHQPMESKDGRLWIVYNGEVYNFQEMRNTLEKLGVDFHTRTDTEVILKAYEHWGIGCLKRFVGMFAFALWDRDKERLVLARDRIGIKPLFYHLSPKGLLFGSELKAIMSFRAFPRELEEEAIPLFLHYQYVPSPMTVFKNTFKLLPGHYAVFDQGGFRITPYWGQIKEEGPSEEGPQMDEEEFLRTLDRILTEAVADRLVSDVPLGGLLSGGIDSSLVVALMQKSSSSRVRTFSVGFHEKEYNEAPWAKKIAQYLGTRHTQLYVSQKEALEVIPRIPEYYDEPFADSSAVPTFLVSRLARSAVTVALSGDGGDEQFAGYVRYWTTAAMAANLERIPLWLRRQGARLLRSLPVSWVQGCYEPFRPLLPQKYRVANFPDKWRKLGTLLDGSGLQELYRMTICLWPGQEIQELLGRTPQESAFEEAFRVTEGWSLLSRLMHVDQTTYLPDAMLTKVDRASMAAGLEVRVPLLDHRVLEYTSALPEGLKYRKGTAKYLLKRLLGQYLPRELFERPKMGFGLPVDLWLRDELKELLLDYLSPARLKREGRFRSALVERKVKEHLSGRANHQYRLWSLLVWEMWRERWLDSGRPSHKD